MRARKQGEFSGIRAENAHTLINGTNMPAVKCHEQQQANCCAGRRAFHRKIARSYRDAHPFPANIESGERSMRLIKLRKRRKREEREGKLFDIACHVVCNAACMPRNDISISKQKGRRARPHILPVKPIRFQCLNVFAFMDILCQ